MPTNGWGGLRGWLRGGPTKSSHSPSSGWRPEAHRAKQNQTKNTAQLKWARCHRPSRGLRQPTGQQQKKKDEKLVAPTCEEICDSSGRGVAGLRQALGPQSKRKKKTPHEWLPPPTHEQLHDSSGRDSDDSTSDIARCAIACHRPRPWAHRGKNKKKGRLKKTLGVF